MICAVKYISEDGDYMALVIETNLTDEEKAIIIKGREEYKIGGFVPLESVL